MKLYITQFNRNNVIGGGFTFNQNLVKALKMVNSDISFVNRVEDADIYFISGATQTEKGEVDAAIKNKIPIVFRVNGIPKPSRNRRANIPKRLKDYANKADVIVYQSQWSNEYSGYYLGENNDGMVIYNGVDTDLFNPNGDKIAKDRSKTIYLCVQHSSNSCKRFEEVKHIFSRLWQDNKNIELWLVGRFNGQEYNYNFIDGEKVREFGIVNKSEIAKIMRTADVLIYPSYADSCPNVVLEAKASGLKIIGTNKEGGTREVEILKDIGLERMGNEYNSLFKLINTRSVWGKS